MSLITEMIIFTSYDDEAMVRLNVWCAEHDTERQQQFEKLDGDGAGGRKFLTAGVWAMAGNYFPSRGLVNVFPSFGWRYPESAILIVDAEDTEGVQIYRASQS